jgi:DNA-binding beta-propeller fold protein YncE
VTRRRRRLIIALVILAILLTLLSIAYVNYRATRNIGFGLDLNTDAVLAQPRYLYSFGSEGVNRLLHPLGVLVDGDNVYVTDSQRGEVIVYTLAGKRVKAFGKGHLLVPLYIVKNPKTGEYWVADRRLRSIEVFTSNGTWLRTFNPKLPKAQLPKFETGKIQWAPVALAFAPDGTLYVTEILNGHRLLEFDPTGKFVKSTGSVGIVEKADAAPDAFQFPNNVKVLGNEVWVADSNNRRLKVYSRDLEFKRFLVTSGLPRGMAFLPRKGGEPQRLVVVDTLAHDATIWEAKSAKKVLNFGTQGVLEGQFNYPNDVSSDGARRMFIADSSNGRIQVWGWPAEANPIPTPQTPLQWLFCLSPLLLLPLLLLTRRKRFFATADFVLAMYAAEEISLMPGGRRRWFVTPEDYDELEGLSQGDISLGELLNSSEHSESDARALMQRFELDYPSAVTLSIAQRARVFCTESAELRRLARVVEIDVVNRVEFLERFAKKRSEDAQISADRE